jgi:hypothetical protein
VVDDSSMVVSRLIARGYWRSFYKIDWSLKLPPRGFFDHMRENCNLVPTAGQRGALVPIFCSLFDRRNKRLTSRAKQDYPLPNRVNAVQAASAARTRAPARRSFASPLHLSKTLHPHLIEISHREQHAIDCSDNSDDFAPTIDRVQPMGNGGLL